MDIPQGNHLKVEQIEQLELGMSTNQVKFLLGSPALVDLYRPNDWHYIYYFKSGQDGSVEQRRMTLTFTKGLLTNIDGEFSSA